MLRPAWPGRPSSPATAPRRRSPSTSRTVDPPAAMLWARPTAASASGVPASGPVTTTTAPWVSTPRNRTLSRSRAKPAASDGCPSSRVAPVRATSPRTGASSTRRTSSSSRRGRRRSASSSARMPPSTSPIGRATSRWRPRWRPSRSVGFEACATVVSASASPAREGSTCATRSRSSATTAEHSRWAAAAVSSSARTSMMSVSSTTRAPIRLRRSSTESLTSSCLRTARASCADVASSAYDAARWRVGVVACLLVVPPAKICAVEV